MSRHLDHEALTIWKLLLKEGGYWRVREIGDVLGVEPCTRSVRQSLDRLLQRGMVRARQVPGAHPSFGVTASCAAPPGYDWMLQEAVSATGSINWAALEALHA